VTDPARLREAGETFERAMLASLHLDEPTADERKRVLAALGVALPFAVAPPASAAAKGFAWSAASKGVVATCLAVAVTGVIAAGVASRPSPIDSGLHAAAPLSGAEQSAPRATPRDLSAPSEPEPALVDVSALPAAPTVVAPVARPSSASPQGVAVPSVLAEEISQIDEARIALAEGSPTRALALLDAHHKRGGLLVEEATALRVEALIANGESIEAARIAQAFVAEHPTSPLGHRIRTLAGLDAGTSIP